MKNTRIFFMSLFIGTSISIQLVGQNKPIQSLETLGTMTLHVIPQSHIDLSWWWRYDPETIHIITTHTLETAFENMEKFPEYTFTHLQVPVIEPLEELYPELFYKLQYYVHNRKAIGSGVPNPGASGDNGRLAIGSGLWCEPDGCLPCGESVVRQCLYGKRWYKHHFGIDVKTAWFRDAWTHPWTYPQIMKKSGIESYMFIRPGWMSGSMFWWESPDGSRVFTYNPLPSMNTDLASKESIDRYLLEINRKYGIHDGITLIGVGNHGGGAIKADVERMQQVMQERNSGIPGKMNQGRIIFSTPKQFTSAILNNNGNFPVIKYELEPTFRGAYTTVGEIKKGNRYSENLLMTLEKVSSIASNMGVNIYPDKTIYDAWKKLMINQFHDPISGTDILPSIDDVLLRYQQIIDTASALLIGQLKSITKKINTMGEGIPIVVFNPLSWKRTDIVEAELELPGDMNYFSVNDENNHKVPVQIIECKDKQGLRTYNVIFLAENIPSMGYSTYFVKPEKNRSISKSSLQANQFWLENEFFSIKIDSLTGCLAGITDKQNKREVLAGDSKGNLIQIIDDFGDSEGRLMTSEGKEINLLPGIPSNVDNYTEIQVIEDGPVRATIQIKREFQMARFIQRIYLYQGIDRIDFELAIDWQGKNKMVKVSFPLDVQNDSAVYEIPYGTIQRPSLGEEHTAQKWVDISDEYYGVSVLNDSRYGYDVTKNTIRLSVLRSPARPVESLDDKGVHRIKYALYLHKGNWRESNTIHKGYEFNYPLIAVAEGVHKGSLPAKHSFIEISPENLVIEVLKKAEDSDDLIMRFFETSGIECTATVNLSEFLGVDAIHKTDLLENELEQIAKDGQRFDVKVGKYSIETYKLIKDIY